MIPVPLTLDAVTYAIGRANYELEYRGIEKKIRVAIEREVTALPDKVISILNSHPELRNLPAAYITPHKVKGRKIVFAPYIAGISSDIGFLSWDGSEYRFTSNEPRTGILIKGTDIRSVNKGETIHLHHSNTLQYGNGVFEITMYLN